nr:hypothetical protein Iba_chr02eCG3640 [Ipomoea batatas]
MGFVKTYKRAWEYSLWELKIAFACDFLVFSLPTSRFTARKPHGVAAAPSFNQNLHRRDVRSMADGRINVLKPIDEPQCSGRRLGLRRKQISFDVDKNGGSLGFRVKIIEEWSDRINLQRILVDDVREHDLLRVLVTMCALNAMDRYCSGSIPSSRNRGYSTRWAYKLVLKDSLAGMTKSYQPASRANSGEEIR